MNFLLTQYIYPIKHKIILSKKYNFYLDNPRNEEEISAVFEYVRKSYSVNHGYDMGGPRIPIENSPELPEGAMTLEDSLEKFFENYKNMDSYISEFHKNISVKDPLKIISKMWVIVRYEDGGAREELHNEFQEIKANNPDSKWITILNDENPLVYIPKKVINYSYLLSIMSQKFSDELSIRSFIIQKDYEDIREHRINNRLNNSILLFAFTSFTPEANHLTDYWCNFYFAIKEFKRNSKLIDSIVDTDHEKILIEVSDILNSIGSLSFSPKHELLSLTSILELLLTHNPDYNRFNVEDSISKQFKLKTCLILYLNDSSISLNQTHKRLNEIYSQRSNIAHGNFSNYEKYLEKKYRERVKNNNDYEKSFVIEELNADLIHYIKVVLHKFIDDPEFITYLKQN